MEFKKHPHENRPYLYSRKQSIETFFENELNEINESSLIRAGIMNFPPESPQEGGPSQIANFVFEQDLEKILSKYTPNNDEALIQVIYYPKLDISEKEIRNSLVRSVEDYLLMNESYRKMSREKMREKFRDYHKATDIIYRKPLSFHKLSERNRPSVGNEDEDNSGYIVNINEELADAYIEEIVDGNN